MNGLKSKVEEFLKCQSIAVVGVSNQSPQEAANINFNKLSQQGYTPIPVNPNYQSFQEEKCYPSVLNIEGSVEAALIFTPPEITPMVLEECLKKGIQNIWVHRSFGQGSCSKQASKLMKEKRDINFIDGACPMMFVNDADWFHKCFKSIMKWTGRLPN